MKTGSRTNAAHVIRRISDLRRLTLGLAEAGHDAGLFDIEIHESGAPVPAEHLILKIAASKKASANREKKPGSMN